MRSRALPRFLVNTVAYSGTTFLAQSIALVQKLVLRHLLAPAVMGIWDLALVIQNIAATFNLGVNTAAGIELPGLHGGQAVEAERRVRATTLAASLVLSLVVALGVVAYGLLFMRSPGSTPLLSVLVAASLVVPTALTESLATFLQGIQRYVTLSRAALIYALLGVALLPLCAWWQGIEGLLAGAVAVAGLQPLLLYAFLRAERVRCDGPVDGKTLRRLLRLGVPIKVAEYPAGFVSVVDTLVVTSLLGLGPLALYALARNFFFQVVLVPGRIASVFVMRSFHLSGTSVGREVIANDVRRFLLVQNLVLNPLLVCAMIPAYDFLVLRFIPAYAESLPVLRTVALSICFLPQTTVIRNFWMLDRKFLALGALNVVGLVAMVASVLIAVHLRGASIETVAAATVVAYGVYYSYLMLTAGRWLWGLRGSLDVALNTLVGVAATALAVALAPRVGTGELARQLGEAAASVGTAVLLLAPVLAYGAWRTRLVPYVWSAFRPRPCPLGSA